MAGHADAPSQGDHATDSGLHVLSLSRANVRSDVAAAQASTTAPRRCGRTPIVAGRGIGTHGLRGRWVLGPREARCRCRGSFAGPMSLRADVTPGRCHTRADVTPGRCHSRSMSLRADVAPGRCHTRADVTPGSLSRACRRGPVPCIDASSCTKPADQART